MCKSCCKTAACACQQSLHAVVVDVVAFTSLRETPEKVSSLYAQLKPVYVRAVSCRLCYLHHARVWPTWQQANLSDALDTQHAASSVAVSSGVVYCLAFTYQFLKRAVRSFSLPGSLVVPDQIIWDLLIVGAWAHWTR